MQQLLRVENYFPIGISLLSLVGIAQHGWIANTWGIMVGLIGLAAMACYFLKLNAYKPLMYFWLVIQIPVLDRYWYNETDGLYYPDAIWNVTQGVDLAFSLELDYSDQVLNPKFNYAPLLLFGLLKLLGIRALIGSKVEITGFREDSAWGDIFPLHGTLKKRISLSAERDWVLVELDEVCSYDGREYDYVIIKRKDEGQLKRKKDSEIAFMRIVYDIGEHDFDRNQPQDRFPFVDWVWVKVV